MLNVRKAKTLLSAHYAHMLEYRAEIFLWALSNSLPIILMGVWIEASQNGDFDFSPQEFARYFFSVLLVRQFTTIWVIWDFEREIVEGKLSLRLLQPIDPVWHHVALAFILRFAIQYTFAMLAFWTERASAIQQFWGLFYIFLSGAIAPLEVFPDTVRQILEWTPFPYMMHFPAILLMGLPVNFGSSILIMIGWTIVFIMLNRWLWRKGLKQYSGMGA